MNRSAKRVATALAQKIANPKAQKPVPFSAPIGLLPAIDAVRQIMHPSEGLFSPDEVIQAMAFVFRAESARLGSLDSEATIMAQSWRESRIVTNWDESSLRLTAEYLTTIAQRVKEAI